MDALEHLYIQQTHTPTNFDFPTNEIFPSLTYFHSANNAITTLDQSFFERQKALSVINASSGNPFHCDCKMAWLNHVSTNLGWTVLGGCDTPASLYGNSITGSSNYLNCPNNQSYHCFNDTFVCPQGINCVNAADSAYCDCGEGYTVHAPTNTCQDTDECSAANSYEQNCSNTIGSYERSCMPRYTWNRIYLLCKVRSVIDDFISPTKLRAAKS